MSGGSLDYFYCQLDDHVGDFKDKELDELVFDLAALFHDREWYLSGDTGDGDWNEARDNFKAKWFTQHGRQERIEKYLADLGEEVRKSLGISTSYCRNCTNWTQEKDGSNYGRCKYSKGFLRHRSESCDKFDRKGESE